MSNVLSLRIEPGGRVLQVPADASLRDLLFQEGLEFPCGGRGRCKGCRVKVIEGELAITPDDQRLLSPRDLAEGWRLACQARASAKVALEIAQWEMPILADDSTFPFKPAPGVGIAVDLGTTTLVAQLLDLQSGAVLAVRTALNRQAGSGADIMSRIEAALRPSGRIELQRVVRAQIGALVEELLAAAKVNPQTLEKIILVGNNVMAHLFCGFSVESLARHPFEPEKHGLLAISPGELSWCVPADCLVEFLPMMGGFVGSDILAGIAATGMRQTERLEVLVDLGTNGEMVIGNRRRLLYASTAAGPAFEGAGISCGMRAATGAISSVRIRNGQLESTVLGSGQPRGVCGSGLVDAVACGLELGLIHPSGKLAQGNALELAPAIRLIQSDIRELQLAKAAIAAGLRLLLERWGATVEEVERVWLAGAFGNYISRPSAQRIGLLSFPLDKIKPVGNTALLGAKLALFEQESGVWESIQRQSEHVPLNEHPQFMDWFVEEMRFPIDFNQVSLGASGAILETCKT